MEFLAPPSMAMLAMVRRPSTDRCAVPSPWNSCAWYRAPSSPNWLMRKSTTSLPDTHGFFGTPLKTILMVSGTRSHNSPVVQAAARSVEPMPVANVLTPP